MTTPVAGSVLRAFEVLNLFRINREMRAADVADELGIPRSSAYRILITLREAGALESTEDGVFFLGMHMFELGCSAPLRLRLHRAAAKPIQRLSSMLGSTVQLGILDGDEVLFLEKSGLQGNPATGIGRRGPVHASAIGKVLLAFAPARTQEFVLGRPLHAFTKMTITSPTALRSELMQIRNRGFAVGYEEKRVGYFSVARPVREPYAGGVIGAVSVILRDPDDVNRSTIALSHTCKEIEAGLLQADG